jgi:purine-cytosine permease-like protein
VSATQTQERGIDEHGRLPGGGVDAVGAVESHGIDFIPLGDRHSKPRVLLWVLGGEAFFFGVMAIGWLPIAFGLGWWSAFSAIVLGNIIGALIVCPMGLLGPRTGTNGPVSSGAYFGVVGRLIGTLISIFIAVGFAAIAIWTSGQAVLEGMHRLFSVSTSDTAYAITYAIVAAICLLVAIYGHANVVAAQKILFPAVGLMMIVGAIVFAGKADTGYNGGHYLLGGFWQTWVLALVTMISLPISLAPYVNDYARYIAPHESDRALAGYTFLGCLIGPGVPCLFAAWTSIGFKDPLTEYIPGLVANSPTWFVVPIILVGLIGGTGQAAFCLYGVGLDTSSLIPRLKRVPATLFLGSLAVAFVFIGDLVLNATDTVSAFVLLFITVLMPWTVIVVIGHFWRRGFYKPDDLQVFNRGERGGVYWFTGGVNLRALVAYVPAATVGALFLKTSLYTGPWSDAANGIDLSFISAGVIAAVVYVAALLLFPEPDSVKRDSGGIGGETELGELAARPAGTV